MLHGAAQPSFCGRAAAGSSPVDSSPAGPPSFFDSSGLFPSLCTGLDLQTIVCEACQLAKHRRSSFRPSMSHTSTPLYRIHSDVWGPAPQSSLKGHRYFVIFVDEASRILGLIYWRPSLGLPPLCVISALWLTLSLDVVFSGSDLTMPVIL